MNRLLMLSATLLLSVSVSHASLAQGRGEDKPGKGGGGERAQGHDDHRGKGGGKDNKDRGPRKGGEQSNRQADRDEKRDQGRDPVKADSGRERDPNLERNRDRDGSQADSTRDRGRQAVALVPYRDYGLIRGCPPGLAKKNNGCLPPGQAKKAQRVRYDFRWGQPNDGFVHRYDNGYQYRYDRQGSLLGYLPALGGALSAGSLWPAQYRYDPAPRYQRDYYGLNEPHDYRYADGAIYAVDTKTATIQRVVALLTGQSSRVGERLPSGYDVYNVPYTHRDQYRDTEDAAYRYNDGAIYQVNPKTQVIMSIIQLLGQKS